MRRSKTYKRTRSSKRKTARRGSKRQIIRRRKGGVNNNNDEFIERRANLINTMQDIVNSIEERVQAGNVDEMTFVDEIRAFEPEADIIDNHFGNNDMEDMLNATIQEVMESFGLINPFFNNNNNTISIVSARREPNSNMSNNNNNMI